jgi:hypothetical protein
MQVGSRTTFLMLTGKWRSSAFKTRKMIMVGYFLDNYYQDKNEKLKNKDTCFLVGLGGGVACILILHHCLILQGEF